MINFIDLLNWAATAFVWLLGFLLVAGAVVGILNILLAPFLSKPKPRDWAKEQKESSEAWIAEAKRCDAAGLPWPEWGDFMDMREEQRKAARVGTLRPSY
jgi:hypothetical protein